MNDSSPYIAVACGGTGGHLFPGLAVAVRFRACGCRTALLVSPKEVDQAAVKDLKGMEVFTLPAVAFQSGSRLDFVRGCWTSFRIARKLFQRRTPHAVLAMGGFTSAPAILAARSLGAKTFLHESNTIPGRANRWLSRLVDQAFVGFPEAARRLRVATTVTGTPVRGQFAAHDQAACRRKLGFNPAKPVVLVTGGSQGATGVNDLLLRSLPEFKKRCSHWQWLHLTGTNDCERVTQGYAAHGLRAVVHPFLSEMDSALGAADAVVARSGASSLAEIAAVRVPAVLIPFPAAADNHQWFNARAFAETGAAKILDQKSATAGQLVEWLVELVESPGVRGGMQKALAQWHAPNAAQVIGDLILKSLTLPQGQLIESSGSKALIVESKTVDTDLRTQDFAKITHA